MGANGDFGRCTIAAKEATLASNKIAGKAAEARALEEVTAQGYEIVASQVGAQSSAGLRFIDHLVRMPDGTLFALEVKAGNALRSSSQVLKDGLMASEGADLVGKNAPEYLVGESIKLETVVLKYSP